MAPNAKTKTATRKKVARKATANRGVKTMRLSKRDAAKRNTAQLHLRNASKDAKAIGEKGISVMQSEAVCLALQLEWAHRVLDKAEFNPSQKTLNEGVRGGRLNEVLEMIRAADLAIPDVKTGTVKAYLRRFNGEKTGRTFRSTGKVQGFKTSSEAKRRAAKRRAAAKAKTKSTPKKVEPSYAKPESGKPGRYTCGDARVGDLRAFIAAAKTWTDPDGKLYVERLTKVTRDGVDAFMKDTAEHK